jgi:predicted outer membrane protein
MWPDLFSSELLGSTNEMVNNFAATLESAHRKTAIGIAQLVMWNELALN